METRDVLIWLNSIRGLGGKRTSSLLEHFETGDNILSASVKDLVQVDNIGTKTARAIQESDIHDFLDKEFSAAEKSSIMIRTVLDDDYPAQLRSIYDPPAVLYIRGELKPDDIAAVAIVGTRRCSVYGKKQARRIAAGLASRTVTIVSGCAVGIDTSAHKGAIDAGGRTIGVLGSGLSKPYPKDNVELMKKIVEGSGAVISEFHLSQGVQRANFIRRNRVISGLSLGTLVVEAPSRSGALITARYAYEQGRDVFAVPGNIDSPRTDGTHRLIQDGAKLVQKGSDIIQELGDAVELLRDEQETGEEGADLNVNLKEDEKKVFSSISTEPVHIDSIIESSGLSAGSVSSILILLEMKNMIEQLPGKNYARV